jgi:hypothetical protein
LILSIASLRLNAPGIVQKSATTEQHLNEQNLSFYLLWQILFYFQFEN